MGQPDSSYRAFARLGDFLRNYTGAPTPPAAGEPYSQLEQKMEVAGVRNPWFTREEIRYALSWWGELLREDALLNWFSGYPAPAGAGNTVAIITAGNVPLVGFHDFLSVLLTGNRALVKCSSSDDVLLPYLAELLLSYDPDMASRISFETGTLSGFDAVIATGSNNTSRYFEYYFGSYPHIIRKNRNSAAVLNGTESKSDLAGLADDVFRYFGLGCRSVSKLFVPEEYDFDPLFNAFFTHKHRIDHQKYANNYDYNKAVYLMSGADMLDNGFLLLKRDVGLASPIGTLFFESYASQEELRVRLEGLSAELQCVVGPENLAGAIPFGHSQQPGLDTYADQVDTVDFLLSIPAGETTS